MAANAFKAEKDALCFLGLLSNMYKRFDNQVIAPDKIQTHTHGLNIQALIIDNATGNVLGLQQNAIHSQMILCIIWLSQIYLYCNRDKATCK